MFYNGNLNIAHARFEIIYEHILPECKTLCDLGCGYGDFIILINTERQLNSHIDITAKMIVAAQRDTLQAHLNVQI